MPSFYPQYQYPQYYQPQGAAPQMQQLSGMIWVLGEAGAKSYLVAPNTTVALFDRESKTIYLKSADAAGIPSMTTLDYTIRGESQNGAQQTLVPEYATRADYEELKRQLDELRKAVKGPEE